MARIRKVKIENFRGIQSLDWQPSNGINCLIGHGDSGKSTLLDAIDLCIGARRSIIFCDTDFYQLNVENPISITVTIGDLSDNLKNIDTYGAHLRGFCDLTGNIEDEPSDGLETVLSVNLSVGADLEPVWCLISDRAQAQGLSRNLGWADRVRLSPTRIGNISDFNLSWRKGSILNKLSDETADASLALTLAAREARAAFGDSAQEHLTTALAAVKSTADELGIPTGGNVKAMLDAHSISFSGGTISLHDANGIPLKNLGIGSTRLLIAGLQRKAAESSSVILIDELEYGLEPHRIIRLLGSLGAKETSEPLQVFMTTHSPTALRELSGKQLYILRPSKHEHNCIYAGTQNDIQATIRCHPEAFLSSAVLVCEGASEVGFIRGLDQHRSTTTSNTSIHALGICLVDAGGVDNIYNRAKPLKNFGYTVAVLRDDDKKPDATTEHEFTSKGGKLFFWQQERSIEDEIFFSVCDNAVVQIVDYAISIHGDDLINNHLLNVSKNTFSLQEYKDAFTSNTYTTEQKKSARQWIAAASKINNKSSWFKNVSAMEYIGREIIAPNLSKADPAFRQKIDDIFAWAESNE